MRMESKISAGVERMYEGVVVAVVVASGSEELMLAEVPVGTEERGEQRREEETRKEVS